MRILKIMGWISLRVVMEMMSSSAEAMMTQFMAMMAMTIYMVTKELGIILQLRQIIYPMNFKGTILFLVAPVMTLLWAVAIVMSCMADWEMTAFGVIMVIHKQLAVLLVEIKFGAMRGMMKSMAVTIQILYMAVRMMTFCVAAQA